LINTTNIRDLVEWLDAEVYCVIQYPDLIENQDYLRQYWSKLSKRQYDPTLPCA